MRRTCKIIAALILAAGLLGPLLALVLVFQSGGPPGLALLSVLPSALMILLLAGAAGGGLWMLTSIDERLERLTKDKA